MIEEQALVVSVSEHETWIETQRQSACGQCQAKKGCGTAVFSRVLGKKSSRMKAINKVNAHEGDLVNVGLSERALLQGALMTYLLPLFLMVTFAVISQEIALYLQLDEGEWLSIICAFAGLWLGLVKLRKFSASIQTDENFQPVILKVVSVNNFAINN